MNQLVVTSNSYPVMFLFFQAHITFSESLLVPIVSVEVLSFYSSSIQMYNSSLSVFVSSFDIWFKCIWSPGQKFPKWKGLMGEGGRGGGVVHVHVHVQTFMLSFLTP